MRLGFKCRWVQATWQQLVAADELAKTSSWSWQRRLPVSSGNTGADEVFEVKASRLARELATAWTRWPRGTGAHTGVNYLQGYATCRFLLLGGRMGITPLLAFPIRGMLNLTIHYRVHTFRLAWSCGAGVSEHGNRLACWMRCTNPNQHPGCAPTSRLSSLRTARPATEVVLQQLPATS
jgi:hypothetical protein